CVEDCPVRLLDEQSGVLRARGNINPTTSGGGEGHTVKPGDVVVSDHGPGDKGGASRFFYSSKVSKKERNAGLPDADKNDHPTVKPIGVMKWLVKMVTPPGGVVLDPFMGSGSTGCAAAQEGFDFIGCDLDPHYLAIAAYRIQHHGA